MNPGKIAVSIVWVAAVAAFFMSPTSTWGNWGRSLFWVLAGIHAIECAVFYRTLQAAPGSLGGNLFQTFLFGILHVREVRAGTS